PGLLLFEFLASPFAPGLWKLTEPLARVFMTVSQFLRGKGVLVKRAAGHYEIGTYVPPEDGGPAVQLSDSVLELDGNQLRWGLFGRKAFGITWEPGTPFHERIAAADPLVADGGDDEGLRVNVCAADRLLEGVNDDDGITRTEEHAKAEYGGGQDVLSDKVMAGLIALMLVLGSASAYLMVA
ncbi:MAG: hypothetical protein ACNS61_16190, partial [Candidatus Wenzhouxiangella sp. M2_3B_020]